MAEEAKSELGGLRAEFKTLTGKNPSPRLNVEGLRAKLAELKAAPAQDPPAADPPADPPAADPPAQDPPVDPAAADPPAAPEAPAEAAPEGTVYLRHPEGIGCSFRGIELAPDKKGRVLAPASAAEELAAHGFEAL